MTAQFIRNWLLGVLALGDAILGFKLIFNILRIVRYNDEMASSIKRIKNILTFGVIMNSVFIIVAFVESKF